MRTFLLLLLLLLAACPETLEPDVEEPCQRVGEARILEGWEPSMIGPLNNPRSGDAYLANDVVQAVIQGPGRGLAVNPWGGTILDADVVRPDGTFRDVFGEVAPFINLAGTGSADEVVVINDGACGDSARVRASGTYVLSDYVNLTTGIDIVLPGALDGVDVDAPHPLRVDIDYSLPPGQRWVDVAVTVTNEGAATVPFLLAWLAEGGLTRAFLPREAGWDLGAFGAAEYMVFAGEGVAYGMLPLLEERLESRGYVSFVGAYALAHDRTALDIFGYPDSADLVAPGSSLTRHMAFVVAETHADVVGVIGDILGLDCHRVAGVVSDDDGPLAGVHVAALEQGGRDLGRATTGEDGAFEICTPTVDVELIAGQPGRPYAGGGSEPLRVPWTGEDLALTLPLTGRIQATITDDGPIPARMTVYGVDPSPHSYHLDGDGFDPYPPGVVLMADSADGTFDVQIEPGDYDVVFTRGPEYSMSRQEVVVGTDAAASLTATLHRVVDTTGYLSGDFHVHAQASPDSLILDADRVLNMAAEGVEILVSTDHAYITDYAPLIEDLGLQGWMTSQPGQEITTFDYGHFNGFPLDVDATKHNGGAIDWTGLSPDEIAATVTDQDRVFQINHPRAVPAPGEGNYFNNVDLQFDAQGPYMGEDARDPLAVRLAKDAQMLTSNVVAMEVMTWLDVQGLADWFNFQNAGLPFTATGNSDTHTLRVESSGWPRNYVRLDGAPADLDGSDLVLALQRGRNVVGFGPFVRLDVDGASVGDTVTADGEVTVTVNVQAPTWIPFEEVQLIDGATNTVLASASGTAVVSAAGGGERRERELQHTFTPKADTWLTVIVTGTQGLFPGVPYNTSDRETLTLAAIRAGDVDGPATPFAMTNPVWIDADGDGQITPSHLVVEQDFGTWRWEDRTNPY